MRASLEQVADVRDQPQMYAVFHDPTGRVRAIVEIQQRFRDAADGRDVSVTALRCAAQIF